MNRHSNNPPVTREDDMPVPIGLYVRITDDDRDPETGLLTRAGVELQIKLVRRLLDEASARLNATFAITVYDDNDITAADDSVIRPDFERMVKDLESGVIRGFAAL